MERHRSGGAVGLRLSDGCASAHVGYGVCDSEWLGVQSLDAEAKCRVYRTSDCGASWQGLTAGLPQKDAFITVLRDAFTSDASVGLYFGTRSGELYASTDDGETWETLAEHLPPVLMVRAATL